MPPKLLNKRGSDTDSPGAAVLTRAGSAVKQVYMQRRERHNGCSKSLNPRVSSPQLWNYVGRICDSMEADYVLFVDKLIESAKDREGFPYPTKLASGYAGKTYLKMIGVTGIDDWDDEGCLLPHALPKVRELTMVASRDLAKFQTTEDMDCVLPVDELGCVKAELETTLTAVLKSCGTRDFMDPRVTEFATRPFCVLTAQSMMLFGWRNPAIRERFLTDAKTYLVKNPAWLRYADMLGQQAGVRALRVTLGLR